MRCDQLGDGGAQQPGSPIRPGPGSRLPPEDTHGPQHRPGLGVRVRVRACASLPVLQLPRPVGARRGPRLSFGSSRSVSWHFQCVVCETSGRTKGPVGMVCMACGCACTCLCTLWNSVAGGQPDLRIPLGAALPGAVLAPRTLCVPNTEGREGGRAVTVGPCAVPSRDLCGPCFSAPRIAVWLRFILQSSPMEITFLTHLVFFSLKKIIH